MLIKFHLKFRQYRQSMLYYPLHFVEQYRIEFFRTIFIFGLFINI